MNKYVQDVCNCTRMQAMLLEKCRRLRQCTASLVDSYVLLQVHKLAPSSDATSSGLKADVAPSLHISSIADMLLSCTTS